MCAHAHTSARLWGTIVRGTALLCGGAVSGRHNPNSKPVPAPWVNNNILLHPALPSWDPLEPPSPRPGSDQMHEPLPSGVTRINPRCQVLGWWLRYFFQGFMALSRWSEAPRIPARTRNVAQRCEYIILHDLQIHLRRLSAFTTLQFG